MPVSFSINQPLYIGLTSEFIHSIENDPDIPQSHRENFVLLQDGHQWYLP